MNCRNPLKHKIEMNHLSGLLKEKEMELYNSFTGNYNYFNTKRILLN
jgi:hypothetical protein